MQFKSVTAWNMGSKVAQAGRPVQAGHPSQTLARQSLTMMVCGK